MPDIAVCLGLTVQPTLIFGLREGFESMCGFIGRIAQQQSEAELRQAIPRLRRRGPDSQSIWFSEDRRIGLLHARLIIVDPDERANQPFTDPATGTTVAFNGEIYNYLELKDGLADYPFRTNSDTEVILACYVKYGLAGLQRLKGMFALAIVDERARRVILARDPIGKKPLFLACWGEEVLFGSSLLALKDVWGRVETINPEAVTSFWGQAFIHPAISVFKGARPVLPGQVLEFDWTGQLCRETTCHPVPTLLYNGEPSAKVLENVRELLDQAVFRRVSDLHPPTVLLSGGIDSTVITAAASAVAGTKKLDAPIQALTLGAMVPLMNDEFYARYAARRLHLTIHRITPKFGQLSESVTASLALQDEPLGMISYFLLERLVDAAANYGRILLTGDGGDEVFLGYGQPRDWRTAQGLAQVEANQVLCGPALPNWFSSWGREMATNSLVGHGFTKVDRASAEQGVEVRCPLLDWDLISYVRTLPYSALFPVDCSKSLLKGLLRDWPGWFIKREKMGFVYNIRWFWGASGYKGLREAIDKEALSTFEPQLPAELRKAPAQWKNKVIFQHFQDVWKLLSWSCFLLRTKQLTNRSGQLARVAAVDQAAQLIG